MNEFISDFKQWVSDMVDNPEIIGSELANVGGKIARGVAVVTGGAIESEVGIDIHGSKALKKVFGRSIPLVRGCVLKVYYGFSRSRTGVYIGDDTVITLFAAVNKGAFGDGVDEPASLKKVCLEEFCRCSEPVGFEQDVYVAASAGQALHMDIIADRAVVEYERYSGRATNDNGELPDNVHAFTYYCITGRNHPDGSWKEFELDDALESALGKPVSWRPIESY